jgi:hypothetical protein
MCAALGGTEPGVLAPLEVVKGHLGASATIVVHLSEFRQLLARAADIGPRILSQARHPLDKVLNGVLARALETAQLGPVDWDRYRRAGARAG